MSEDLAITIMQERLEAGVNMVKKLAESNGLKFAEPLSETLLVSVMYSLPSNDVLATTNPFLYILKVV